MLWNEKHLLSYIENQVGENINLDYKAAAALSNTEGHKKEITKDVSAFLNSGGGTIIYGIIEENQIPLKPDPIDPILTPREWLEHVINNIKPRPEGIVIYQVHMDTTSPGMVCYAVEIPQGDTAYQASDWRYYKRFNFESRPMEDYEVKDVMNRQRMPFVTAELFLTDYDRRGPQSGAEVIAGLQVRLRNMGNVIAPTICVEITLPDSLFYADGPGMHRCAVTGDERTYKIFLGDKRSLLPLPPKMDYDLFDINFNYITLKISPEDLDSEKTLRCLVYAGGEGPNQVSVRLKDLLA